MATKADFTADEWNQIRRAPFMAGLAVVAASPSGPFGVVKEMFAVGKMLAEVKTQGASNDLVKALVADLETGAREQARRLNSKASSRIRSRVWRLRAAGKRSRSSRRRRSPKKLKGSSSGWSRWGRRFPKPRRRAVFSASAARK